jgi:hypothetical protein
MIKKNVPNVHEIFRSLLVCHTEQAVLVYVLIAVCSCIIIFFPPAGSILVIGKKELGNSSVLVDSVSGL